MGRILQIINVNGRKYWTLFDIGARNTYLIPEVASSLTLSKAKKPFRSVIGVDRSKRQMRQRFWKMKLKDDEYLHMRW